MARPVGSKETPESIILPQLHKAMKMQGRIQNSQEIILEQYETQLKSGTLTLKEYDEILQGFNSMTSSLSKMVEAGLKALKRDDSKQSTEDAISPEDLLGEISRS